MAEVAIEEAVLCEKIVEGGSRVERLDARGDGSGFSYSVIAKAQLVTQPPNVSF